MKDIVAGLQFILMKDESPISSQFEEFFSVTLSTVVVLLLFDELVEFSFGGWSLILSDFPIDRKWQN